MKGAHANSKRSSLRRWFPLISTGLLLLLSPCIPYKLYKEIDITGQDLDGLCPLGEAIRPLSFINDNSTLEYILKDEDYKQSTAQRLGGVVKIPSISYDEMPEPRGGDAVWEPMKRVHEYLEAQFPLVHTSLTVEKVNEVGLLYTWTGSNPLLKPMLLTAHMDVVPVEPETRKLWKYEPFSGHYDGERVWGRGASDDKSMLMDILEALEKLLKEQYQPLRSIVVGFGYDEESAGNGAYHIAQLLQGRYGENSFYSLVDEGSSLTKIDGRVFAFPSVAEKGATALTISLTTPGGHSSVPPPHTNIGIMAKLIDEIESSPFGYELAEENPTLTRLQCVAKYTNTFTGMLKKCILGAHKSSLAKRKVVQYLSSSRETEFNIKTTQAIDIIKGGVKENALPEYSSLVVDHRINVGSSWNETTTKILDNVLRVAEAFNLGVVLGDDEIVSRTADGVFQITWDRQLEPAPVSPTSGQTWDIFSGSIKHIVEDYIDPEGPPAVVTGNLMMGNTDTCQYWNLTENIYRFSMSDPGAQKSRIHSVNEYQLMSSHLYGIGFIYEYIKNVNDYATVP